MSSGPPPAPPPHGITLFDHAEIAAALAEGERPEAEVLRDRGLTSAQWVDATMHWMRRMGDDALENGAKARVAVVYAEAFGRAQDALRAPPTMDPEAWAALTVAIQQSGDPAGPLAERRLSTPDLMRLVRHFARLLPADVEASRRFTEAYVALQPDARLVGRAADLSDG